MEYYVPLALFLAVIFYKGNEMTPQCRNVFNHLERSAFNLN
ncbi:hypothetical protein ROLI_022930 [Roseobacter fucihabitans]|uniref:Uncharacterized protein n=1 Tax=Roseobacter fucihabitans TaxID=1537242 RepID=A0ABZ2BT38_9RHOB|nr:hypothetical protein [Roseobacter litoralis]